MNKVGMCGSMNHSQTIPASLPVRKPSYNIRKAAIFGSASLSKTQGILE